MTPLPYRVFRMAALADLKAIAEPLGGIEVREFVGKLT